MKTGMKLRRGFVLLLALAMLMVVSTAIAALAMTATAEGRQKGEFARVAQVDQLLLAGTVDARRRITDSAFLDAQAWSTALPASLVEQNATIETRVVSLDQTRAVLSIRAVFREKQSTQTVTFARDAGPWRLIAAELE